VTGNVSTGNVSGATGNFTDVVGSLYGDVTGNVTGATGTFTTVTGALQTASQTNITTVGTLGTLAVTGNVSTGNVSGTTGTFGNIRGKLLDPDQSNITTVGNLTALSVSNDSYFEANVWVIGNVLLNNVFGNLISGNTASFTDIVGTVQTSAQPYITTVGTLGTLAVTGDVTAANVVAGLVFGTIATVDQPNITRVGTLGNLDVGNDVTIGHDLTIAGNLYELRPVHSLRLLDITLPQAFAAAYAGPAFGISGTRALCGVPQAPLIGTIISERKARTAA
jgi:hypothetical protein